MKALNPLGNDSTAGSVIQLHLLHMEIYAASADEVKKELSLMFRALRGCVGTGTCTMPELFRTPLRLSIDKVLVAFKFLQFVEVQQGQMLPFPAGVYLAVAETASSRQIEAIKCFRWLQPNTGSKLILSNSDAEDRHCHRANLGPEYYNLLSIAIAYIFKTENYHGHAYEEG